VSPLTRPQHPDNEDGEAAHDEEEDGKHVDRALIYRLLQQSSAEEARTSSPPFQSVSPDQQSVRPSSTARVSTHLKPTALPLQACAPFSGTSTKNGAAIAFSFRQPRASKCKPRREGTWQQLLDFVLSNEGKDSGENLLACYRVLCRRPTQLLSELLERHADACSDGARQSAAMRRRVLHLLRHWMRGAREWYADSTDELLDQLTKYAGGMTPSSSRRRLHAHIEQFKSHATEANARQASLRVIRPTTSARNALAHYSLLRDATKDLGNRLTLHESRLFSGRRVLVCV
jgi:hypothetical protein